MNYLSFFLQQNVTVAVILIGYSFLILIACPRFLPYLAHSVAGSLWSVGMLQADGLTEKTCFYTAAWIFSSIGIIWAAAPTIRLTLPLSLAICVCWGVGIGMSLLMLIEPAPGLVFGPLGALVGQMLILNQAMRESRETQSARATAPISNP